jgi:thiol-disulfide isomerase/thioredoxin
MRNILKLAVPIFVAILATFSHHAAHAKTAPGKIPIGELVPSHLGIDRNNNKISATNYAGKVLVVTFWASWCGPCKKELPILENLQRAGKGQIQVIAINIEDRDKFRAVARALDSLTLMLAHDYTNSVAETFGVKGIPHMLIIGRDQRVISVHRGYGEGMIPQLVTEINAALTANQPPSVAPTPPPAP